MALLTIENLKTRIEGNDVLRGIDLTCKAGELCVVMGPNGSGKSSLANTLAGHPHHKVIEGEILLDGKDLGALSPEERARHGLFVGFQHPPEIPGVSAANLLRTALKLLGREEGITAFRRRLDEHARALAIPTELLARPINEGFSGGERKKLELLQLLMLEPRIAILDEPDSGLDIDALRIVAAGVRRYLTPERAVVLITHYKRILEHLEPSQIHILKQGRIVRSGGPDLAEALEREGYAALDEQG